MNHNPDGSTVAIVQARTASTRLPGKVLAPVMGQPMILRQLERLSRSARISQIVVATSDEPQDDELAEIVTAAGYPCVRGEHDDVLARFRKVLDIYPARTVVRITADCPLISPSVVDTVVSEFMKHGVDYASNTLEPMFPDGLDVEVFRAQCLTDIAALNLDTDEKEHVTLGIYRRPERFRVLNVPADEDYSQLRWTVDVPEDLTFVSWVFEQLLVDNPDFDYLDVLHLLERHPEMSRTSAHYRRNAALDGVETGALRHQAGSA